MTLLKLTFRNIFAHKLRNTIITLVLTFVVLMLFLFLSFSDGEIENINKSIMGLENPKTDIVIKQKGYLDAKNANESDEFLKKMEFDNYPEIISELKKFDFIKNIYVKTESVEQDIYINNNRYLEFAVNGLEADNSPVFKEKLNIVKGHYFKETEQNVIIIHNEIKKDLNVDLDDIVTIIGNDLYGQTVIQKFKIIGFYVPIVDNPENLRSLFVDMNGYNMISGLFEGEASSINIDLIRGNSLNKTLSKLNTWAEKNNYDIEFISFKEFKKGEVEIYQAFRFIIIFISFISILIIMFGVMNIISVNLQDRKKEIGSFYCLGAEKIFLIALYSLEILSVNIFSTIAGISIGLIVRQFINSVSFTTDNIGLQLVFGSNKFYLGLNIFTILYIVTGVILITIITCIITLNKSLNVSPSVAVREITE